MISISISLFLAISRLVKTEIKKGAKLLSPRGKKSGEAYEASDKIIHCRISNQEVNFMPLTVIFLINNFA
jgi:hypothetical protein